MGASIETDARRGRRRRAAGRRPRPARAAAGRVASARPTSRRWSTSSRCSGCWPRRPRASARSAGPDELRVKESDRIAVLVAGLRALGADVEELPDGFVVTGPTPLSRRGRRLGRRPPDGDGVRRRRPGRRGAGAGAGHGIGRRLVPRVPRGARGRCDERPRRGRSRSSATRSRTASRRRCSGRRSRRPGSTRRTSPSASRDGTLAAAWARPARRFAGWNVTRPLKEAALALVDRVAPEAAACGSVNTVVLEDGRTDRPLHRRRRLPGRAGAVRAPSPVRRAVILGTGGATRAVAAALAAGGTRRPAGRPQRGCGPRGRRRPVLRATAGRRTPAARTGWPRLLPGADLVVNATPLGDPSMPGRSPIPDDVALGALEPRPVVFDLVYRPRRTPLLERAAAAGCADRGGDRDADRTGSALVRAVDRRAGAGRT